MIERLRDYPDPDELAAMYATPHDSTRWGRGHAIRVDVTIATGRAWNPTGWAAVLDLACGDGRIPHGCAVGLPTLGDIAPGPHEQLVGPLEQTIRDVSPGWDLFVCSETLEHLADPEFALALMRSTANELLLSTPIMGADGDTNGEHVWCWDREGVEQLLRSAGWTSSLFVELDTRPFGDPYRYGIWIAR